MKETLPEEVEPIKDPTTPKVETKECHARIQKLIGKEKLLKLMECPICNEITFPPINTCRNGHIVCNDCHPRLHSCAICRASFRDRRNLPMEEIINGSEFTCSHKDLGCSAIILGMNFTDHLKCCEFNPFFVLCNDQRGTPCSNSKIRSKDYLDHLIKVHQCFTGPKNRLVYRFIQYDDSTEIGKGINTDYFEHEGEAFLQKWQFHDGVYYTWICSLKLSGIKLEDWTATVQLHYKESVIIFTSTLTLHEASKDLSDVMATRSFMCLFPSQVKGFGEAATGRVHGDRTWDYCWESEVKIYRNNE